MEQNYEGYFSLRNMMNLLRPKVNGTMFRDLFSLKNYNEFIKACLTVLFVLFGLFGLKMKVSGHRHSESMKFH